MLGYGIFTHINDIGKISKELKTNFHHGISALGGWGLFLLFNHAYSLGAGTYNRIEAVSNGLQIMRVPRVQTGKRTMLYMSTSLAPTVGGIFICYLLLMISAIEGQTLNSVLASNIFSRWQLGHWLALITLFTEDALLLVAPQTGFVDGPRVMANIAVDSWFPQRFSSLREQLTHAKWSNINGWSSPLVIALYEWAISHLVIMYAINVSLTLSLSKLLGCHGFLLKIERQKKNGRGIFLSI